MAPSPTASNGSACEPRAFRSSRSSYHDAFDSRYPSPIATRSFLPSGLATVDDARHDWGRAATKASSCVTFLQVVPCRDDRELCLLPSSSRFVGLGWVSHDQLVRLLS